MRWQDYDKRDWRCRCGRLLGVHLGAGRYHLRFAVHEYIVGPPVVGKCPNCQTINEIDDRTKKEK